MSVSHETQRKSKLTYEHYTQLPDDGNRHEIVDGVHYMNPAPIPYHQALSRHIQFQLYSAIELNNLGEVIDAPIDVQFSNHDVVQPDLVVVLKGNNIATRTNLKGTPDLIIEILSPSTSSRDEGLKKELYEQNHAWASQQTQTWRRSRIRPILVADWHATWRCWRPRVAS